MMLVKNKGVVVVVIMMLVKNKVSRRRDNDVSKEYSESSS